VERVERFFIRVYPPGEGIPFDSTPPAGFSSATCRTKNRYDVFLFLCVSSFENVLIIEVFVETGPDSKTESRLIQGKLL